MHKDAKFTPHKNPTRGYKYTDKENPTDHVTTTN